MYFWRIYKNRDLIQDVRKDVITITDSDSNEDDVIDASNKNTE